MLFKEEIVIDADLTKMIANTFLVHSIEQIEVLDDMIALKTSADST